MSRFGQSPLELSDPDVRIFVQPGYNGGTQEPLVSFLAQPINQWTFESPERLGIFWLNYLHLKVHSHGSLNIALSSFICPILLTRTCSIVYVPSRKMQICFLTGWSLGLHNP